MTQQAGGLNEDDAKSIVIHAERFGAGIYAPWPDDLKTKMAADIVGLANRTEAKTVVERHQLAYEAEQAAAKQAE